jgi:hypothetical protein
MYNRTSKLTVVNFIKFELCLTDMNQKEIRKHSFKFSTISDMKRAGGMTATVNQLCTTYAVRVYHLRKSVQVKVMLRPTVSRPVCLGVKHPSGAEDQIIPIR